MKVYYCYFSISVRFFKECGLLLDHFTGISYLSRAQESASKFLSGNPILADPITVSSSPATVADTVFVGRIRSRVKNWRQSCIDSGSKTGDGVIASVRQFHMNLILLSVFQFFYIIHLFVSFQMIW